MKIKETYLKGCYIIEPTIFKDERGLFFEEFNTKKFKTLTNWPGNFVQDNRSISKKGALRGLHFQKGKHSQAKLVNVVRGAVIDVVVDIRKDSPTFGKHFKINLNDQNHLQLFIPKGFAHGFLSLEENTVFSYKCDEYYCKEAESGIRYNDEVLNIDWGFPQSELILSEKDENLKGFNELIPFEG